MKVQWRRNPLFPSTQKPGVFAFSSSLDESGAELNTNQWRDLNGIDEEQLNTFKFALGTWTVFGRRNRQITKLSHQQVNELQNQIASDEAEEPKPNEPPFDYLEKLRGEYDSIAEWALDGEPILIKHDDDSGDLDDPEGDGAAITISAAKGLDGGEEDGFFSSWDDSKGKDIRAQLSWQMGGTGNDRVSRRDLGGYDGGVARYYEKKVGRQTKAYGRWNKKGKITPDGYWEVYDKLRKTDGVNRQYLYFRPNFASSDFNDRNSRGTLSPNLQWKWEPANGLVFDTDNGLEAYGKWIPSGIENFIQKETSAIAENAYVGIATTTDEIDPQNIEPKDLLIYHDVDSLEYNQNSAPIEINFSLNFAEIDPHPDRVGEIIKYFVLEWGDEDIELTSEDILNSEFFEIYESDDDFYDKFTVKKVMQSISNSKKIEFGEVMDQDENVLRSGLDTHIYTEPGVKTIKCIVFRFDASDEVLLETSLIYSQIFVSDPNQKLQNFNIFGASDFTVLPLESKNEFIFGSIDHRSDYAMSLKTIEVNDLYESSDYLEKIYNEEFLPNVSQSLYGNYAGNLDLGLTRVFSKPFDLYDFITDDKQSIVDNNFEITQDSLPLNSSATEILIGNEDCVVELDPSNKNNLEIENTAKSDEKGVMVGDYAIVKEKGEKFRKDDNMDLPRLEQKIDRQAF